MDLFDQLPHPDNLSHSRLPSHAHAQQHLGQLENWRQQAYDAVFATWKQFLELGYSANEDLTAFRNLQLIFTAFSDRMVEANYDARFPHLDKRV